MAPRTQSEPRCSASNLWNTLSPGARSSNERDWVALVHSLRSSHADFPSAHFWGVYIYVVVAKSGQRGKSVLGSSLTKVLKQKACVWIFKCSKRVGPSVRWWFFWKAGRSMNAFKLPQKLHHILGKVKNKVIKCPLSKLSSPFSCHPFLCHELKGT